MTDLGAEAHILGLLVVITSVISISAVVSKFVFVLAGHVGVLEVTVVLLLVCRWRIFALRNNSGHNGAQNQNLKFSILGFQILKITTEEEFSSNLNPQKIEKKKYCLTHHKRSLHVGGCRG
jgi:ABC-type transport system involved in Fe-S cluster assembly fused permease/ATPase subunit